MNINKTNPLLLHPLNRWMQKKKWSWFKHQVDAFNAVKKGSDVVVFAPTGAGKTLTGFINPIDDLSNSQKFKGLHTIYISPLKSLANDIERNLEKPIKNLDLKITFEVRTGDTTTYKKQQQKKRPPNILITTPESLALLNSYENANTLFKNLKFIIIDEIHTFLDNKRADLLSLNIERLQTHSPKLQRIGLSATLKNKNDAKKWLCRKKSKIISLESSTLPKIKILQSKQRIPWSGHMATYAINEIYKEIIQSQLTIIFVNTRAQAEYMFKNLWLINKEKKKIAVHHGSLERSLRLKVEKNLSKGLIDCVVATSSLELGLDYGNVEKIIQVGAPKGINRLLQRVGRSNHNLNTPSKAVLVPTNRFEFIEAKAAIVEISKGNLDLIELKEGSLDVVAQHIFATACSQNFNINDLYSEIIKAYPYKNLQKKDFIQLVELIQDGGYVLKNYDQFKRIQQEKNNKNIYRLISRREKRKYRMNVGTIIENPMLKIKLGTKTLGNIEEVFIQNLSQGDSFIFAGKVLEFQSLNNNLVQVKKCKSNIAKIPSYSGGRMPLSTNLAKSVRELISSKSNWISYPSQIKEWLNRQKYFSILPKKNEFLIEQFPRKKNYYTVIYSFAGWHSNQTLGFLLLRGMKDLKYKPLGFVANDYAIILWSLEEAEEITKLLNVKLIDRYLENYLEETSIVKRLFRDNAIISCLIERRLPGMEKTGKQVLFSSDLIYSVLKKNEPNHILLKSSYDDAKKNMIDYDRLIKILTINNRKIILKKLKTISPLAVPIILEINRENLSKRDTDEYILEDLEKEILKEANVQSIN